MYINITLETFKMIQTFRIYPHKNSRQQFIIEFQTTQIQIMTDPTVFAQAQIKINQVITQIHRLLSQSFVLSEQARDLLPDQNAILQQLNEKSIEYKNLVGILAIDTYTSSLVERMKRFDDIQAIFSIHIENILSLQRNHEQNFTNYFKRVISSLVSLSKTFSQYYPESAYIQNHKKMLQSTSDRYKEQNKNCYQKHIIELRQENTQLKARLKTTDIQINKLEMQLQDILKQQSQNQIFNQRQGQNLQEEGQGEGETANNFQAVDKTKRIRSEIEGGLSNRQIQQLKEVIQQLKSQIYTKQQQINRMNQQFTFQVLKYNTVFSQMKSELTQLRSYANVNYINQIQRLQTFIIRMREEHERDQLIIQQLKQQLNYSHSYGSESRSSFRNSRAIPEVFNNAFKKPYSPKYNIDRDSMIRPQTMKYPQRVSYGYGQAQHARDFMNKIPGSKYL